MHRRNVLMPNTPATVMFWW